MLSKCRELSRLLLLLSKVEQIELVFTIKFLNDQILKSERCGQKNGVVQIKGGVGRAGKSTYDSINVLRVSTRRSNIRDWGSRGDNTRAP